MKKMAIGIAVGVGISLCLVSFVGIFGGNGLLNKRNNIEVAGMEVGYNSSKLEFIHRIIKERSINEIDDIKVTEGIYKGYVYGLDDQYTKYLSVDDFNKEKEEEVGYYVGVGIEYAWGLTNQHLIVTNVIEGSAADREGIVVGDKIIAIDDILAMESNTEEIYDKLTYSGKDAICYTVVDNNEENERNIFLSVESIKHENIESELLNEKYGYIKIKRLIEGTVDSFKAKYKELSEKGATSYILDLRNTYSDNIEETVALCNLFLDEQVVFSVEDYQNEVTTYKVAEKAYKEPIAILTNNGTEGTIEAFVAAMKEAGRAKIVGTQTKGNGTIQEKFELEDGSGLIITTGIIKTPKGIDIRNNGIEPDYVEKTSINEMLELITTGIAKYEKDTIIQKAIEIIE
ncbi:MAG: S41 family peptidase [Cellulosilyticaceae bacterium]